jgi:hypothetical protein
MGRSPVLAQRRCWTNALESLAAGCLACAALRLRAALRERGVRREEIGEQKEKSKRAEVANIIIDTGFSVLPSQLSCSPL